MKVMIYSSHLIPGDSTTRAQSVYSTLNRRAGTEALHAPVSQSHGYRHGWRLMLRQVQSEV